MTNKNPFISVLMLGFNDKGNLKEAIDSVLDQSYKNYELIYIDNASSDGSFEYVKKNYPEIQSIFNEKNLGYAGAYEIAIREAFDREKVDAVILLNTDVVVDKTWLEEMVKTAFQDDKIALVQPKIYLHDKVKTNLINTFGNNINYLGFGYCGNYKKEDNEGKYEKDIEIATASGCSLLIKKQPYLKVGNLDASFFAYVEDQDLSWRTRMFGYKIVLSTKSKMWHKYGFSKNKSKFFLYERNRLFFIFKNYQFKTIVLFFPIAFVMELGLIADSILSGYFIDKLRSYGGFLGVLPRLMRERKQIQKNRTKKDSELKKYFSEDIIFAEVNSGGLNIANGMLRAYYKIVARLV